MGTVWLNQLLESYILISNYIVLKIESCMWEPCVGINFGAEPESESRFYADFNIIIVQCWGYVDAYGQSNFLIRIQHTFRISWFLLSPLEWKFFFTIIFFDSLGRSNHLGM